MNVQPRRNEEASLTNDEYASKALMLRMQISSVKHNLAHHYSHWLEAHCPLQVGDVTETPVCRGKVVKKVKVVERKIHHYQGHKFRWVFVCEVLNSKAEPNHSDRVHFALDIDTEDER